MDLQDYEVMMVLWLARCIGEGIENKTVTLKDLSNFKLHNMTGLLFFILFGENTINRLAFNFGRGFFWFIYCTFYRLLKGF